MGQILSSSTSIHPKHLPSTRATKSTINFKNHSGHKQQQQQQQQKQNRNLILSNIHTLSDLTPDTIRLLQSTNSGRICIDQVRVGAGEYRMWRGEYAYRQGDGDDGDSVLGLGLDADVVADTDAVTDTDLRGVEYDANTRRVVIKAIGGSASGSLESRICYWSSVFFSRWFEKLTGILGEACSGRYGCIGSTEYTLSGPYKNSTKRPDAGIQRFKTNTGRNQSPNIPTSTNRDSDTNDVSDYYYPLLTLETTLTQSQPRRRNSIGNVPADTAQRWLEGSRFGTKLVALIEIDVQGVAQGEGEDVVANVYVSLWRLAEPVRRVLVGMFGRGYCGRGSGYGNRVLLNPELKEFRSRSNDEGISFRVSELVRCDDEKEDEEMKLPLREFGVYLRDSLG